MEYKIERVPVPKTGLKGRPRKYPFGDMKVGDSIQFRTKEEYELALLAAHQYGSRYGWKFLGHRAEFRVHRTK